MTDFVAFRCERRTKAGTPCRTPVVHPGAACANHKPAVQKYDSRKTQNRAQDLVKSFIENYRCGNCEAAVELVAAGQAQLILVSHDSTCPQIVARVKRVAA